MKATGELRSYTYYHCTKKRNFKRLDPCRQQSATKEQLEEQILEFLGKLRISDKFLAWVQKYLKEQTEEEIKSREATRKSLEKKRQDCTCRLDNLFQLKIFAENSDSALLSDEEFKQHKNEIIRERESAQAEINSLNTRQDNWIELACKTFQFCKFAQEKFKKATDSEKRIILSCLGSNLRLKDGNLGISAHKVFQIVAKHSAETYAKSNRLEPHQTPLKIEEKASLEALNPIWRARQDSNLRHLVPKTSALSSWATSA